MQEIRDVILDRAARLSAGDAEGLVAHHAPQFVSFDLAPPLGGPIDGRDPKPIAAWLATFDAPPKLEVTRLEITAGPDVAFATSIDSMSTPQFTLWFRVTLGLRRVDGRWLVTHEHQSVPFHMDEEMRAAVELKP